MKYSIYSYWNEFLFETNDEEEVDYYVAVYGCKAIVNIF